MTDAQPHIIRIRLRYPDQDTFLKKFAPNVTRGGIFLASRDVRPVGEVVRFEISLRQGETLLAGHGRVAWVREYNPAEPHRPYGMGAQFVDLDEAAQPILELLLQNKPAPAAPTSVRSAMPMSMPSASAPVLMPASAPASRTGTPLARITATATATATAATPTATAGSTARHTGQHDLVMDEFDGAIDETGVRRAVDRARALAARTDDVSALLAPDPEPRVSLRQALTELPRLLGGRRP